MPQENYTPGFKVFADELIKEIPKNIAELAKGLFKGSFIKQDFTDSPFSCNRPNIVKFLKANHNAGGASIAFS